VSDEQLRRVLDLIDLKKYDLAIREARQVLKEDPENVMAHYFTAWALWKLGRVNEAIKADKKALSIDPEHAYAHRLMGFLLDDTRKFKKARPHYQKAIQLMPGEADFYVSYSSHLYGCFPSDASASIIYPHTPLWRDWENAVKLLEQALQLNPQHAGAYRMRAMWLKKKQRFAEARQDMLTALQLAPNDPFNHAILGAIYLAEYQSSQAFAAYREALRLTPEDPDIRKGLTLALAARTPWIGALWRLSWGQPGGWRGGLLAVLVLSPMMCTYAMNLPKWMIAYVAFMIVFFTLLRTVGDYFLTQAVIKGWIKI
jgi:tetratricopeptide (TPR) repeat protein